MYISFSSDQWMGINLLLTNITYTIIIVMCGVTIAEQLNVFFCFRMQKLVVLELRENCLRDLPE